MLSLIRTIMTEHFMVLLLAVLALGAWAGTLHLIHTTGIPAENVAWAREQTATIIGALLMLITGRSAKAVTAALGDEKKSGNDDAKQ